MTIPNLRKPAQTSVIFKLLLAFLLFQQIQYTNSQSTVATSAPIIVVQPSQPIIPPVNQTYPNTVNTSPTTTSQVETPIIPQIEGFYYDTANFPILIYQIGTFVKVLCHDVQLPGYGELYKLVGQDRLGLWTCSGQFVMLTVHSDGNITLNNQPYWTKNNYEAAIGGYDFNQVDQLSNFNLAGTYAMSQGGQVIIYQQGTLFKIITEGQQGPPGYGEVYRLLGTQRVQAWNTTGNFLNGVLFRDRLTWYNEGFYYTLLTPSSPTSVYNNSEIPPNTGSVLTLPPPSSSSSGPFLVNYNSSFLSWVQGNPQVFSNSTNYEIFFQGEAETDPNLNNSLQIYRSVYNSQGELTDGPQLILQNQTQQELQKFYTLPDHAFAGTAANFFLPIYASKASSQPAILYNGESQVLVFNSQFELLQNITSFNSNVEIGPYNGGFIYLGYTYNQLLNVSIYNSQFQFQSTFQALQPSMCAGSLSYSYNMPFVINNNELILIWDCYNTTSQSYMGAFDLQNGAMIRNVLLPYSINSPILTQINTNQILVTWYGGALHNYAQINTMVFNQQLQNTTGVVVVNEREIYSVISSNINVVPLSSNRFAIVWTSTNNEYNINSQGTTLWIQHFDTLGNLEGANLELTTFNQSNVYYYSVASTGNTIMVAWPGYQNFEIYAQVFPFS